jgi:hypothetical protein
VVNERLKLLANFANTVAAAFLSVGVIGPALALLYGLVSSAPSAASIVAGSSICVLASVTLHLSGRAILGGLRE